MKKILIYALTILSILNFPYKVYANSTDGLVITTILPGSAISASEEVIEIFTRRILLLRLINSSSSTDQLQATPGKQRSN